LSKFPKKSSEINQLRVKMLLVGDLHGRKAVLDALVATQHQLVFLGDFLDAYEKSATRAAQIECIDIVRDLHSQGRARFVRGNHDWSYDSRCQGWASGYAKGTWDDLGPSRRLWLRENDEHVITLEPDIVISHAGITAPIWDGLGLTHETVVEEAHAAVAPGTQATWFFAIGRARRGMQRVGGPLWCDWDNEFEPVQGVRQVTGHTRLYFEEPMATKFKDFFVGDVLRCSPNGDWNIDCLGVKPVVLEYDNGELRPYHLTVS
jgi:predicted phosphodiesterase